MSLEILDGLNNPQYLATGSGTGSSGSPFSSPAAVGIGSVTDAAVVNPASSASAIAALKGVMTAVNNIPAQGQALAAASVPVVLTASQLSTLTPITGGSTAANQATEITSLASIVTNTTGAATAANQTTGNTSLSSIATNTANIPAKGSATSANSTPVVIASDQAAVATISAVPTIATSGAYAHTASIVAYAANQLWANNTLAGSVTFQTITVAKANNQAFTIVGASLKKSGNSVTNAIFRAHLLTAAPTTAVADRGTFAAGVTLTSEIGYIDFNTNIQGSDIAFGLGTFGLGSVLSSIPVSGAQTLYIVYEVKGAYTPLSAETLTLTLFVQ